MDTTDVIRGVKNQNNRGNNKQLIQQQISNCKVANESLRVLLSPTDRSEKFQFIKFKESIITHILINFKHPADIMKLINTASIPVIPLPTFTKVTKEYGFTNVNALTTEEK